MKHVNDNSDNPFDNDAFVSSEPSDYQMACEVCEILAMTQANYSELGDNRIWRELVQHATQVYLSTFVPDDMSEVACD